MTVAGLALAVGAEPVAEFAVVGPPSQGGLGQGSPAATGGASGAESPPENPAALAADADRVDAVAGYVDDLADAAEATATRLRAAGSPPSV